jgi:hypothetical protein
MKHPWVTNDGRLGDIIASKSKEKTAFDNLDAESKYGNEDNDNDKGNKNRNPKDTFH